MLISCAAPKSENPIPFKFIPSGSRPTDELIMFLPGRGDEMSAFESAGFINSLHQSNRVADSIVIDAHMGYFLDGSLPKRIYFDILLPFHKIGYKRFIIVGVSLGGYGALWINHEYNNLISGVVLFAPYLGREPLIEKIDSYGAIHLWRSQLDHQPEPDEQVWLWVDDLSDGGRRQIDRAMLAVGERDKFSEAAELLSRSIPDSQVFKNDDGHNWTTWHSLWVEILKSQSWEQLGYTR